MKEKPAPKSCPLTVTWQAHVQEHIIHTYTYTNTHTSPPLTHADTYTNNNFFLNQLCTEADRQITVKGQAKSQGNGRSCDTQRPQAQ